MGCDTPAFGIATSLASFNPRTRVGCDSGARFTYGIRTVSIHAPVWGATWLNPCQYMIDPVSIHAPVWGATAVTAIMTPKQEFQSTHPCGVRQLCADDAAFEHVSIHAPVWGATHNIAHNISATSVSIHAPVWGATAVSFYCRYHRPVFQSTHPCGVRHPKTV